MVLLVDLVLLVAGLVILGALLVLLPVGLVLSCFQIEGLVLGELVWGGLVLSALVPFWFAKLAFGVFGLVGLSLCLLGLLWIC